MLTVLGGLFESMRRCAGSQVPASMKKADDFCWAQEPQLGDFSSQYMVSGNMADSSRDLPCSKVGRCQSHSHLLWSYYEFKADLDFSPYQAKGEAVLGLLCVQCPWQSELR